MSLTEDLWADDPLDREPDYADPFTDTEEDLLTEAEAFGDAPVLPACEVLTRLEKATEGRAA